MAAELFKNIAELKTYIGGGANVSVTLDSVAPTIFQVARLHIVPWLGQPLYDDVVAKHAAPTPPTGKPLALQNLVQRALAHMSMEAYLSVGSVMLTESGLQRVETDNMKTSFKYQDSNYRDYMREHGWESLEELVKYLLANRADFPLWTGDPASKKPTALVLNFALELREAYSKYLSRYTFEMLRPLVEDVEMSAIEGSLPKQFYAHLKTAIHAQTLTVPEKELVRRMQRAIAHFVIEEAMSRNWVAVQGNRLVTVEEQWNDASSQRTAPTTGAPISLKSWHHNLWANRHMSRWRDYVLANVPEFPLCFGEVDGGTNDDADVWVIAPVVVAIADPEMYAYHPGCCGCDHGACRCKTTKKPAIVTL
jgi:hypothetical protein